MNKKLMAVAVAAAVAAPGLALAQTTIYGKFLAEYGFASQADIAVGATRPNADGFNSGASRVGVRGEEKLGGGNAVWYQCETRARFGADTNPAQAASGICDRNSALGLKGGFGNFFLGRWDTAMEDSSGLTRIGPSTGWGGSQHMLTEDQGQFGISFAQRVQNSINYNSPNFGGFAVNLSTTSTGSALNQATTVPGRKGRIMSGVGKYASGPLVAYVGFETHDDNQALVSGGLNGASEEFITAGISYVIGPVKVGFVYTDVDADTAVVGTSVTRTAYHLAADWKIGGPGTIRATYTVADDFKGTAAGAALADQGATQYVIGYLHALSKRTNVGAYYAAVDNDTNGVYNFHGFNSFVRPGDKASAFALMLEHNF
jgi:predicted porin